MHSVTGSPIQGVLAEVSGWPLKHPLRDPFRDPITSQNLSEPVRLVAPLLVAP